MEDYLPRIEDTELKRNRSGKWEIRWSVPAGLTGTGRARSRSRSCNTADYNLAVKIRREYLSAASSALAGLKLPTVAELVRKYAFDHVDVTGVAPTQMASLKPIVHLLGLYTPDGLSPGVLLSYRLNRKGGLGGFGRGPAALGTIRRELSALGAVLKWSKKNQHLPSDFVLPEIALPPEGAPRELYLDKACEKAFYAYCSRVFRWTKLGVGTPDVQMRNKTVRRAALFSMIALSTAARAQAVIGLTWDRVDLRRRLIDFRDGTLRATKKRRVPVPMDDRLWRELARAWIEQGKPQVGPVLGSFGELRKSFETLKAGFVGPRGRVLPPDLTRHDLRRTWATLAAQDGVPMFQIAGMLGDTLETVEKHYAHHSPEYLRAAVNRDRA